MACVSGRQCLPSKYGGLRRGRGGRVVVMKNSTFVLLYTIIHTVPVLHPHFILSDECDCIAPSKPVLPLLYRPTAKAKDGGECIHSTPIRYSPALSNINKRIRSFFFSPPFFHAMITKRLIIHTASVLRWINAAVILLSSLSHCLYLACHG